jgi:hypothetical protein
MFDSAYLLENTLTEMLAVALARGLQAKEDQALIYVLCLQDRARLLKVLELLTACLVASQERAKNAEDALHLVLRAVIGNGNTDGHNGNGLPGDDRQL